MGSEVPIEFRILGPVEALVGAGTVPLGPPKQRALLATLLLARGAVVSRDRLVDGLWGSDPPASAVESLQIYVHKLRRALGSARIETSGSGYRVSLDDAELDLASFERAVERGRRSLAAGDAEEAAGGLRTALALWRGPALADLPRDAPTAAEAERLEELRVAAVELWNDAELACGRHDALTATLEPLVAEHPYRERLREQQILAFYRSGRQHEALEACREARRVLVDELGIEPGPRLQELERSILRQEPGLAAPEQELHLRARLPVPPTPLVGRRLEIAAITALLRENGVRLVTLTGAGGTGKTRLALAAAAELAPELRDGALFVDLAPVADPRLLASTIADQFDVQEGARPLIETIAEHLEPKRMLLVLDNLEQLLPAVSLIADLLAAAPSLLVLATSRAPLRLSAEHEYPVPPLPVPDGDLPFEELVRSDALHLFTARARAVNSAFVLDEGAARSVAEICRRLDGLPLAIELAAARAKLLSPAEMIERLPHALGQGPRDVPARQRTLTAAIQWSIDLLDPEARTAFGRLAVFAGGATLEAAERVCATTLEAVGSLVDNSLLKHDPAGGRFSMLETVRACALEQLDEASAAAVRRRHAEWVTELAETAEAETLAGGDSVTCFDRLQVEHDNIRAALGWSLEVAPDLALRLAGAVARFWLIRGHVREGRHWLQAVLDREDEQPALRTKALRGLGVLALKQRAYEEAERALEEAYALCTQLGDGGGTARCSLSLGVIAVSRRDFERAQRLNAETIERARALDERRVLSTAIGNQANVALIQGDYEAADRLADESLALARELGHREGVGLALLNLGLAQLHLGRLEPAADTLCEALLLARGLGYQEVAANALNGLAAVAAEAGESAHAARLLGAADALLEAIGTSLDPAEQVVHDQTTATLRRTLTPEDRDSYQDEGRLLGLDRAVAEALGEGTESG